MGTFSLLVIASFANIVVAFLIFVVMDAAAAFDRNPKTITFSTHVKRFVRRGGLQMLAVAGTLWWLAFGLVYLFLHFILQVV